jgi:predicted O-methyltransferase YrrM
VSKYFESLPQELDVPVLIELRKKALEHEIPIIQEDGLRFIKQLLFLTKPTRILEIGTAIGYSTIALALFSDANITTIERDQERALEAIRNFSDAGVSSRITLLEEDALTIDISALDDIDILFIDAAKAQSINFVEKYESLVKPGGMIITDNLLFHGLFDKEVSSRNLRQLLRKINDFNQYILQKEGYDTVIYQIGDGMSVSIKKGGNL